MNKFDILIVGGGAAGFFTAINIAEKRPSLKIAILERGKDVLTKVKISGGGRCNVTHAEFIPKELSKKYPRGQKELLGPFHTFMTGDTIAWFEERGVELKIEEDGRMFPITDSSSTIVDCFLKEAHKHNIEVLSNHSVQDVGFDSAFAKARISNEDPFYVKTSKGDFICNHLVMTTGSNPKMWSLLQKLGHSITDAVPSLFTFNIKDEKIDGLMGLATNVTVKVLGTKQKSEGPLLITHWGMSGPAILKLSAWGARELADLKYQFEIQVNWLQFLTQEDALDELLELKLQHAKQSPFTYAQLELPKRLWHNLLIASGIQQATKWAELTKTQLQSLSRELTQSRFRVSGKSTFKEEFVTAGGVNLKEVNFKTFESKKVPNLYLAGEVLNIDAITGGFNFQNAWTGGYLIAQAIES
ncbi:aminoacetone oxidase family FAD-binding enzyme [Dokdonia sp. Dokd-P16]|uniref:NAD(P)/FAD-dependent oxidoreductase n=1 Tax=Dokdonia sp. Dokd-P16 TaxID=2173169 RepID=UPI000D543F45|nr:NAD(P)/FAD-dependent oxidoreductase [Dokdonia sp. Dokd-P16]AWH73478.1 aminoacetone oxidase family FAD-binding enzyme [Dokdonia sp. Dokd-P16]